MKGQVSIAPFPKGQIANEIGNRFRIQASQNSLSVFNGA
jgi:hypothetical protein